MKRRSIALILAAAVGLTSLQGCIGGSNGFVVTKKIYNWNQRLSNKWVNEVVFLIMLIIPVYGISLLIDGIILNSVEFWTGSNPLAMKPGEIETKYITEGDVQYKMEVSLNRYHFEQIQGPNMGEVTDLVYNPETKTWLLGDGRELNKAAQVLDGNNFKVFLKNGESVVVNKNAALEDLNSVLNGKM